MKTSNEFSDWIFNSFSVTPEGLALYRIFTALFILCFLMPSTEMYQFLGSSPADFYTPPPGPMWMFGGFPSEMFFLISHAILITTLILLLTGCKTFWISILTGITILIIKGFFYSVGKVNHDLLLAIVPVVMAFSGWGTAYSIDSFWHKDESSSQSVESWPLTLLALFIGFMMFTAGFAKVLGGWLYINTQATLGHLFNQYFVNGRQDLVASYFLNIENRVLWELLDYVTVFFEMSFLIAIFHSRTTKLFVSFAILFHFSIMISMNISFLPNFPAYAAFLNWSFVNNKFKKLLPVKFSSPILLAGIFVLTGIATWLGDSYSIPKLNSDLKIHEFYIVLLAVPVAISYIIHQTRDFIFKN